MIQLYTRENIQWIPHVTEDVVFFVALIEQVKKNPCDYYGIETPHSIQRSIQKRQHEFIAGRLCAQAACSNINGNRNVIEQDSQGRPVWPPDLVGSITHTNDLAIAAVARNFRIKSVGIDSEKLISDEKTFSSIQNLVLVEGEEGLIKQEEDFILIFSLKESLYKCLNPLIDRQFDFKDVEVLEIDRMKGIAHLRFCFPHNFPKCTYPVYYSFDASSRHIHSCVWVTKKHVGLIHFSIS